MFKWLFDWHYNEDTDQEERGDIKNDILSFISAAVLILLVAMFRI